MASASAASYSIEEDLRAAICLLALIAKRPEPQITSDICTEGLYSLEIDKPEEDPEEEPEGESEEELEIGDIDEGGGYETRLATLRDKVLDRLAETLARFKSDPKGQRGPAIDPKHVSSTMMIVYHQPARVKLLCAKNEGLNQGGTAEDTEFLDSWKKCMECISKIGEAIRSALLAES
jgi:hypothetical protein